MLVLSRKKGESIIIRTLFEEIEVMYVDNYEGRIKVGITAPQSVNIVRKEIDRANDHEKRG